MEMTQISRSWTFTHHLPGEAEPRSWILEEPTIDGMELAYMRHLESQQKAGLERNYKPNEPGYRVMAEVFLAGFSNGAYKWCGRKFSETFSDEENLKTVALLWIREAETKAHVPVKDMMSMKLLNGIWKQPTGGTITLTDGSEAPELVKHKIDSLVADMLSDPLASCPTTVGD